MARIKTIEEYYCEYKNCDKLVYTEEEKYCYTHTIKMCKHQIEEVERVDIRSGEFILVNIKTCDKCDLYKTKIIDTVRYIRRRITVDQFQNLKNILEAGE